MLNNSISAIYPCQTSAALPIRELRIAQNYIFKDYVQQITSFFAPKTDIGIFGAIIRRIIAPNGKLQIYVQILSSKIAPKCFSRKKVHESAPKRAKHHSRRHDDARIVAEFDQIVTHLVAEDDLTGLILQLIRSPELLLGEISPREEVRAS